MDTHVELALPLVMLAARGAVAAGTAVRAVLAGFVLRDGDHRRRGPPVKNLIMTNSHSK